MWRSLTSWIYLDDNLQSFDLLVGGPGLFQGLVQLLDAVGIILLGKVQQLSLGTLSTHKYESPNMIPVLKKPIASNNVALTRKNLRRKHLRRNLNKNSKMKQVQRIS